jgi:formylmethanofuran dehydrogenase subunit E
MCVQSPWEKALAFHGHVCPGLVLGFRAAEIGLRELGVELTAAEGAGLVCWVENRACAVDAIQAVTGCTLGKANLVVADYGKQVFTFARRDNGKAVRVSLKLLDYGQGELVALQEKVLAGGGETAQKALARKREEIADRLLEMPEQELFVVRPVTVQLPPPQRVQTMVACNACGEGVFAGAAQTRDGRVLCAPCAAGAGA